MASTTPPLPSRPPGRGIGTPPFRWATSRKSTPMAWRQSRTSSALGTAGGRSTKRTSGPPTFQSRLSATYGAGSRCPCGAANRRRHGWNLRNGSRPCKSAPNWLGSSHASRCESESWSWREQGRDHRQCRLAFRTRAGRRRGATACLAEVERTPPVTQKIPACSRGPEAVPPTLGVAEHDERLTVVAVLRPRFIHNVQKGFDSISIGHRQILPRSFVAA